MGKVPQLNMPKEAASRAFVLVPVIPVLGIFSVTM
jgi:hypothetical protein